MKSSLQLSYPRQTVLVTCRSEINQFGKKLEKDNIITLSWHTPISHDPFYYGILIAKKRFSYQLIKKSQVFAINFMDLKNKDDVLYCGTYSGEHINKFKEVNLNKEECEKIECSFIKEALAVFECSVEQEIEIGDHVLFIGKVINTKELKKGNKIFQNDNGNKLFTTTN